MRNNTIAKSAAVLFRRMYISSLWYLAIYALVMTILCIVFVKTGVEQPLDLAEHIAISNRVFLLVIGIIFPLSLKNYVAVGVTRKQFALALSAAALALSVCFTVLYAVVLLVSGTFSLSAIFTIFAFALFSFHVGWLAILGFQLKHLYTVIPGLVCAFTLNWGSGVLAQSAINDLLKPVAAVAATIILIAVTVKASRHIKISC